MFNIKNRVVNILPRRMKSISKVAYRSLKGKSIYSEPKEIEDLLSCSTSEYERYKREFKEENIGQRIEEPLKTYEEEVDRGGWGAVGMDMARLCYCVVRSEEPAVIVETGVCNGVSTLSILLALKRNNKGELYSIDFPFRADEPLSGFRKETFEGYGGAAIPKDKDPGWIIPDEMRDIWSLEIGKSQEVLPKILSKLGEIDIFIHDSEHSHPCMMFEYEISYEYLKDQGFIISDDINWNEAFYTFLGVRKPEWGLVSDGVGYMKKF